MHDPKNVNGNKPFMPTNKKLEFFRSMPSLHHKFDGEPYAPDKSEVFEWMKQYQTEIFEFVFDLVRGKDKRREQLVVYKSGTWQGVKVVRND